MCCRSWFAHLVLFLFGGICGQAQITQQFTGTVVSPTQTISPIAVSNGYGFFATPQGTPVSGSFTVSTNALGPPSTLATDAYYNIFPAYLSTTDSITVSSPNGSFTYSGLSDVLLEGSGGEVRAQVDYGPGSGNGGGVQILCVTTANPPYIPTFPLTIPSGCTARVLFASLVAAQEVVIDLTSLGTAASPITTPILTPSGGVLTASQPVTISDSTPGAIICFTTDGSAPTADSTLYIGPITVSSSETIQAIAIGNGYAVSAVATATYSIAPPTPAVPTAQLIDPVSSGFVIQYSGGFEINPYVSALAAGGTIVQGAAADGVTQILLRIPAAQVGQQFNLSLLNEAGTTDTVTANGGLFALSSGPTAAKPTLQITAVPTTQGPMAFAGYISPVDFVRITGAYQAADIQAVSRNLTVQVAASGYTSSTTPLSLVRPPVVLIHGLWGEPEDWINFTGVTADQLTRFAVTYVRYNGYVPNVLSTNPTYRFENTADIRYNSLGFVANASTVENQIRTRISSYEQKYNVASVQADVIGHSMGGDMAKAVGTLADFQLSDTYGTGLFHKLITIGTPHLGSQLATDLLSGSSSCGALVLSLKGFYSFEEVFTSFGTFNGAVFDLQGGTTQSSSLTALHDVLLPFPMAYVGATSTETPNWLNLDAANTKSGWIHGVCRVGSDVIASALTPAGWQTLFNAPNDSVVALTSQMNGEAYSNNQVVNGVIHSAGLEKLDFIGPAELDHASGIDMIVVNMLNESVTGSDFHGKGLPQ